MNVTCKPAIFYNVLRNYGWGSGNITNGSVFEGVSAEPIKCNGACAAQSSLIQII